MEEILDPLRIKLSGRGLMPVEINRLLKDVSNIVSEEEYFTANIINQRLEVLGWQQHIVDEFTLPLIEFILEETAALRMENSFLH